MSNLAHPPSDRRHARAAARPCSAILVALLPAALLLVRPGRLPGAPADPPGFQAGAAREDITPPPGLPLWGYGGRKDLPATGTRDPLSAAGVVIACGEERLAIVGLDLGRSPPRATLASIRDRVLREAGVNHLILVGSHTHHGPCLELEKTAPTSEYVRTLADKLVKLVVSARSSARPAKIAVAEREVTFNRNRHSRIEPKPVDPVLTVVRLDDLEGKRIATLVNFAAHPTTLPAQMLEWSADFPGPLCREVEKEAGGVGIFLQGACGDLSTNRGGLDTDAFGRTVGKAAAELAASAAPEAPASPSIVVREEELRFGMRINLEDPVTYLKYCVAFFKDLVDAYREEYREGVRPTLTVALVNGDLGVVGVSGEVFSNHAVRLRQRARLPHLLFLGYANGYHQYFPTIEATSEGGYGADPEVSPVEVGAGERLMDRALFHLYDLRKPIPGVPRGEKRP